MRQRFKTTFAGVGIFFVIGCAHPQLRDSHLVAPVPAVPSHHKDIPETVALTQDLAARFGAELPDAEYMKWVRVQLAALPEDRPARLLIHYVDYLKGGRVADARAFVKGLMMAGERAKAAVVDRDLAIFEGSMEFCWPPKGACSSSLGSLTLEYFLPRLQKGEEAALEILIIFAATVRTDGAESEGLHDILEDPSLKKHRGTLARIRKRHARHLEAFHEVWIEP